MMTKPAIAIIQARMSSTRLPGKVLKPLSEKPMIWHIVQRARRCQKVGQVVVATSTETSDDPLADFCAEHDIACHRGSLNNVLSRYIDVLNDYPHPFFVRITGDCPMIDSDFIDRQIQALVAHDGDQIWLSAPTPILAGQGVHSTRSLRTILEWSHHPDDLEHVGSRYLAENSEQFRIIGLHPPEALSKVCWRVTVDEHADYEMMQHLYKALWRGEPILLSEALQWRVSHPELSRINETVQHSVINKELSAKRGEAERHVALFCHWEDPTKVVPVQIDS